MGCQHRHPATPSLPFIHMPRQRIYAVGIQHQRLGQIHQPPHQRIRLPAPAQTAAQQHGVAARRTPPDSLLRQQGQPSLRLRQGKGHGLVAFHRRHRPDTLRHPQKHQSRPGTHRPTAGKYRRSGIAHAAAQTQHLTEGTLVALRVPARQQPPHKLPADGLGLPLIRHDPPSRIVNSEASIPHFLQKTHPLPILAGAVLTSAAVSPILG